VVLSNHTDEAYRQECLNRGAVLYLVKPTAADGFQPIFHMLDEILHWRTPRGFCGMLPSVSLSDLIQLEAISRASSILQISTCTLCGRIHICEGRIVHAEAGLRHGLEAFVDLVNLQSGTFMVEPYREPVDRTIDESADSLLLAAAQRWDERVSEEPVDHAPGNPSDSTEPGQGSAGEPSPEGTASIFYAGAC
jgi:hypothetical protein